MVSRNQEKIDRRIAELKEKHATVEFKGVQADLSALNSVAQYKELVARELVDLDIGILCLNAGCNVQGPVDLVSDADFERVFGLNALHVVYLTKALLPQMQQRREKSLILTVSSGLANVTMPGIASYCATKAMVSNFMEAFSFEVRDKIDVTVWEAGPCYTNLGNGEQPPAAITMTAEKAVRGALCQAGRSRNTDGSYFFHLLGGTMPPVWLLGSKMADATRKKFIDSQKNE